MCRRSHRLEARRAATSVTPIARTASVTSPPCAISTSTCRSFATISSAVCRFLAIDLILHGQNIPQGGPLQRGQINKPEPYYVAALALYRLEQLFKSKKIDSKYKAARFQLLLVVRMLIDPSSLPKMNANDMTKRSLHMAEYLQDEGACENIFNHAIQVINSLATNWGRDTIRNEPITKAIFQKYGQHYPG